MTRVVTLLAALAITCGPAHAAAPANEQRTALDTLRKQEQYLQSVAWKLTRGNAPECAAIGMVHAVAGLGLLDAAGFSDPAQVRGALGMRGDFAVLTVAPDSPAAEAGVVPFADVSSIDGAPLATQLATEGGDWKRLADANARIAASLEQNGSIRVGLTDGAEVTLSGVPACISRFEIATSNDEALADGQRVVIGNRFPSMAYAEDEFAATVAHELAHNLLRHRVWLDANGRHQSDIRLTEQDADRLAPWLLANAGYDPDAMVRFMQHWGPKHSGGILRKRTHEGWDERVDRIRAEIAAMQRYRGENPRADWPNGFVPEAGK